MRKNMLYALIAVIVCLAFLEGVSFLAYRLIMGEPFSYSRMTTLAAAACSQDRDGDLVAKSGAGLLHPYYGYVSNKNRDEDPRLEALPTSLKFVLASQMGFDEKAPLFPLEGKNRFLVAITGGSVAWSMANAARQTLIDDFSRLPAAAGKEVVVLNLALPGYKEPQQLMIVNDLLGMGARFDALINLDGFNELYIAAEQNERGTFPFLPWFWEDNEPRPSARALDLFGRLSLYRNLRAMSAAIIGPPAGISVTAGLLFSLTDRFFQQKMDAVRAALSKKEAVDPAKTENGLLQRQNAGGTVFLGPNMKLSAEDLYPLAARHWARTSILAKNAQAGAGGRYFHYLQPNQYVQGSKELSPEEREKDFAPDSGFQRRVEAGYPLLQAAGEALTGTGVNFLDLTGIFRDEKETVYADDCCHFNERGYRRIAEAIVEFATAQWDAPGAQSLSDMQTLMRRLDGEALFKPAPKIPLKADFITAEAWPGVEAEGLGAVEKNAETAWRWGLGPETTFVFALDRETPIEVSWNLNNEIAEQEMTVTANGRPLETFALAAQDKKGRVTGALSFQGKIGMNRLVFHFARWNHHGAQTSPDDPRTFAVNFYGLRIEER